MAGRAVLAKWSEEAKHLYLKLRVEGLSQINAQEGVRVEFEIGHIYPQQVLSRFEKQQEAHTITTEYLVKRQDKFGKLPFARRYERIAANAEMANALANRFWLENEKADKANPNSLVKYSAEFRQCLASIKEDISGMGVEEMKEASGFANAFLQGLTALSNLAPEQQKALGVSAEDLKSIKVN